MQAEQTTTIPTTGERGLVAQFEYQRQDAEMTLREGLAEYHRSFEGLQKEDELPPEAAQFFRRHDTCHVVFGLDTSIPQEAMADVVTIFGVDISFFRYLGYLKLQEARDVIESAGKWTLFAESIKATPYMWGAYRLARKMKQRFPWDAQEALMDQSLAKIRADYGIVVPTTAGPTTAGPTTPAASTPAPS